MPPAIAARFTMGEAAAIGVVVAEIAKHGRCELPIDAVAARAGVCATVVRNALRQARTLGLLHVEERRIARDRKHGSAPTPLPLGPEEAGRSMSARARISLRLGAVRRPRSASAADPGSLFFRSRRHGDQL